MTEPTSARARASLAPAGLLCLAIASLSWGLNWPVTKYLLGELPILTFRGLTGVIGAVLLVALALARGDRLAIDGTSGPRLLLAGLFNVTGWMVLVGLALLWLPAGETALIAFTMPVWAALLAWPILGERPTLPRTLALAMAFAGLAALMGGGGIVAGAARWPGMLLALGGAVSFAIGTVLAKRLPSGLPAISAAAWQIGLGSAPIIAVGLSTETTHLENLTGPGWWLMAYSIVIASCVAYVSWFAALARLPASVAAIGSMAVPVIGVAASSVTLGEPLGAGQIAALGFTLAGVALATR
jgi:drug/metabolite transporter (DMT)-like permease